jgi:hypothetical protein
MTTKSGKVPNSPIERLAGKTRKGVPNKATAQLKDMILQALDASGGVEYLTERANDPKTASAFLTLVGKVLPMTIAGDPDNPLKAHINVTFVKPDGKPA